MIFKKYMFVFVYILFCIHISHVWSLKTILYSHDNAQNEDFDITTIYRIVNKSLIRHSNVFGFENEEGFLSKYNGDFRIEIRSRTNAIGIPIQTNNYTSIQTNLKELFNAESIGLFQNNDNLNVSYDSTYWKERSIRLNENEVYNSLEYQYDSYYYLYGKLYDYTTLFSLHWIPDFDSKCLTISYIHRVTSKLDILMSIFNENNTLISSLSLAKDDYDIKTVKVTDMVFMKDQKYSLIIKMHTFDHPISQYNLWFGLYQIAQCSNYDEDLRIVSTNDFNALRYPREFKVLGDASSAKRFTSFKLKDSCLNGGYKANISKKMCYCPPGFKGKLCETGCGMNSYGADCKGVCSINGKQMCRGMLMCTNYGCTCPVGLTGPLCDQDCRPGKYGANCGEYCSINCQNTCDRYTGVCLNGCSSGYKMPYCREKYPYFINPPALISVDYETIQLELNFESNNVKGGNEILKYYQILLKKPLNEDNYFSHSEMRLINQSNSRVQETLIDLQKGTKYMVGVLLITDDLNYNENDIVYGEFKTLCEQPQYIYYDVHLISEVKGINVTWDKFIPSPLECNIIEYVLTLMSNQSHNQIYDVQEIVASSETGHFIDSLLPDFPYNIKLTPKTINGPLPSSPIYSITTLATRNNIRIKDVTTTNQYGKIKVNWSLENLHKNNGLENQEVPVTCVIRYKLKRILSCSKNELINDWMSVKVFNQTNYEILDVIPNSQYEIQVLADEEDIKYTIQQDTVYVTTLSSIPKTEPIIDHDHPILITNNSVKVQWKVNPENCSKLNGFFSKFFIELKDITNNTLRTIETTRNYISFDDLKPSTTYEVKVFIKTHVDLNVEHFLFISFTTKYADLKPVDDLMVYKKSLKNRMAGFRWSYANDTNMDGFIVSYDGNVFKKARNVSLVPPTKCSAWPEYYCHTFYNMTPSNTYTFKITPRSLDSPEGGEMSSISFNSIDGLPNPPTNVRISEINNTNVTLQWDIPWILNGALKMFNINAEEISALDMNTCCDSITPIEIPFNEELPAYNFTLAGLKPGSTYSVGVLTVSKSLWYSSPARISVTLHEE